MDAAPVPSRGRAALGWLAALAVAGAAAWGQHASQQRPHTIYTRFDLPAFDAWVYVAMAEQPRVFTLAPWGYRPLTPWAAGLLPVGTLGGFRILTLGSLALAGLALFGLLRRRGYGAAVALAAVAVLGLSAPMREVTSHVFLSDPLTLLLFVGVLWAVEAGAGAGVVALLLLLATLSKEIALMLGLFVALREWPSRGPRGLVRAALVALPAVVAAAELRILWVPHLEAGAPAADPGWALRAASRVLAGWREWVGPVMLFGVTPLAVRGAWRADRGVALGYGSLSLVALALPFAASVYGGDATEVNFFPADVRRLLLYALPPLLVLALAGLEPWLPRPAPIRATPRSRAWSAAGWAAAGLVLLLLPASLDGYRRLDLSGQRDGPRVLGVVRETARAARRLEAGETIDLDPDERGFVWGVSDPGQLERMRWFLLEGWGVHPHYGSGPAVLSGTRGTLLLPCLVPRELELSLSLEAPVPVGVAVFVNERRIGRIAADPEATAASLRVPAEALFRGDNVVALLPEAAGERLTLRELAWRRAGS